LLTIEWANEGIIKVEKVNTESQTADIFTKPLNSDLFFKHGKSLGLTHKPLTECSLCHLTFTSNNTLHKHIRNSHTAEEGENKQKGLRSEKKAGEDTPEEGMSRKRSRKELGGGEIQELARGNVGEVSEC